MSSSADRLAARLPGPLATLVRDHRVRYLVVAGTVTVGVASGPDSIDALTAAGADVVLESLVAFPDWLARRSNSSISPVSGLSRRCAGIGA